MNQVCREWIKQGVDLAGGAVQGWEQWRGGKKPTPNPDFFCLQREALSRQALRFLFWTHF